MIHHFPKFANRCSMRQMLLALVWCESTPNCSQNSKNLSQLLLGILLASFILFRNSVAYAGYYVVGYSGGGSTVSPTSAPPWFYPRSYHLDYNGGGYWMGTEDIGGNNPISKSEGEITATLTWHEEYPGEPFPLNVIVVEDCTANYGADSYGPDQTTNPGSCDNGLGSPLTGPTGTPFQNPGNVTSWHWNASSSGRKYSIKPGGASIPIKCSPYSRCTIQQGPHCFSSVAYKCAGYPVEIGMQGTIRPNGGGNAAILIGQGITGNMVSGGASFSGHTWSIAYGHPFKQWTGNNNGSPAHVIDLPATDLNLPNPHWYYSKDETSTVTCTATATASDSTVIGTVVAEKQISVNAPAYTFYGVPATAPGCFFAPDFSDIHSGDTTGNIPGMDFASRVQTPSQFADQGNGLHLFVQLINDYTFHDYFLSPVPSLSNTDGEYWLDNNYPYLNEAPVNATTSSNLSLGQNYTSDSPREGIFGTSREVFILDAFKMYLMYLPPPADPSQPDVQWVPLSRIDWEWKVNTNRSVPFDNNAWSANPPGSTSTNGTFDSKASWPEWDHVLTNS